MGQLSGGAAGLELKLGEQVGDTEGEAGQHIAAFEHIITGEGAGGCARGKDGNEAADRIDRPNQADAVEQIELDLVGEGDG